MVTQMVRRFVLEKAEGYSLDDSDIAFITAFYSNGIVGSTITVSYTHLDVYKRQAHEHDSGICE